MYRMNESKKFELKNIIEVRFFKRDELTSDLICCEIIANVDDEPHTWFYHEEATEWGKIIEQLELISGFDRKWREKVVLPPFEKCMTIAFRREQWGAPARPRGQRD